MIMPSLTRRTVLTGLTATTLMHPITDRAAGAPVVRYARGARIPTSLAARIKAQSISSARLSQALTADGNLVKALAAANPHTFSKKLSLPAKFDWRDQGRVTPVKNQGMCGSCWVFAAIAIYESAYLIANRKNAVDVSEQEALDCSFVEDDCVLGGWHEVVLLYLQLEGEVSAAIYPYVGAKGHCTSNLQQRPYYVLNWGYVAGGMSPGTLVPSIAAIKEAIYRYGPVASAVATTGWDAYYKYDENGQPNPHWTTDYPNGVFKGTPTAKLKQTDVDHEIAIVGWDDNLGVWLIKNSWDTTWGEDGFMKLTYGSNYAGFGASWVTVSPDTVMSTSLSAKLKDLNLKSQLLKTFYPALQKL